MRQPQKCNNFVEFALKVKIGLEISLLAAHDLHNFIADRILEYEKKKKNPKAIFKIEQIQLRA